MRLRISPAFFLRASVLNGSCGMVTVSNILMCDSPFEKFGRRSLQTEERRKNREKSGVRPRFFPKLLRSAAMCRRFTVCSRGSRDTWNSAEIFVDRPKIVVGHVSEDGPGH